MEIELIRAQCLSALPSSLKRSKAKRKKNIIRWRRGNHIKRRQLVHFWFYCFCCCCCCSYCVQLNLSLSLNVLWGVWTSFCLLLRRTHSHRSAQNSNKRFDRLKPYKNSIRTHYTAPAGGIVTAQSETLWFLCCTACVVCRRRSLFTEKIVWLKTERFHFSSSCCAAAVVVRFHFTHVAVAAAAAAHRKINKTKKI